MNQARGKTIFETGKMISFDRENDFLDRENDFLDVENDSRDRGNDFLGPETGSPDAETDFPSPGPRRGPPAAAPARYLAGRTAAGAFKPRSQA